MLNLEKKFFKKRILIYGLGKSGLSTYSFLKKSNDISLFDDRIIAKIIEIIQNLITTVDSGQPFFSK